MVNDANEHSSPQATDRRIQHRLPIRGIALVRAKGSAMLGDTVDISEHGVCLTLPQPLEVGSSCRLDLEIQRTEKRCTSVVARVCFCMQCNGEYRMGFNCSLAGFVD